MRNEIGRTFDIGKRLGLYGRVYSCECGSVMARDLNGSVSIRNEGLRILMESLQPA